MDPNDWEAFQNKRDTQEALTLLDVMQEKVSKNAAEARTKANLAVGVGHFKAITDTVGDGASNLAGNLGKVPSAVFNTMCEQSGLYVGGLGLLIIAILLARRNGGKSNNDAMMPAILQLLSQNQLNAQSQQELIAQMQLQLKNQPAHEPVQQPLLRDRQV